MIAQYNLRSRNRHKVTKCKFFPVLSSLTSKKQRAASHQHLRALVHTGKDPLDPCSASEFACELFLLCLLMSMSNLEVANLFQKSEPPLAIPCFETGLDDGQVLMDCFSVRRSLVHGVPASKFNKHARSLIDHHRLSLSTKPISTKHPYNL